MSLYWIKNKSKGQQPIELTQKPTADEVFSILMGDQVQRRREFIEDNALSVRNLDV